MTPGSFTFVALLFALSLTEPAFPAKTPNIVLLIVDDLGIGDLGCYGNTTLRTPNIDRLASEGVLFEQNTVPAPICTPSRAAFMTGRHPIRSGMLSSNIMRVIPFNANLGGLPPNETTIASVAKSQGYSTALIGKWHLGLHCSLTSHDYCHHPLRHGFDYYYGMPLTNIRECDPAGTSVVEAGVPFTLGDVIPYLVMGLAPLLGLLRLGLIRLRTVCFILLCMAIIGGWLYYLLMFELGMINCILMRGYQVVEQPVILENLTQRYTQEAVDFLEENGAGPFLLCLSYAKVHTALFVNPRFRGASGHSRYGDAVAELDWSVGQVVRTLDQLDLRQNTFVYLVSDNGGHVEEVALDGQREGGHNGIYRGGKGMTWEGGVRVPTIASYGSHLATGSRVSAATSIMDLAPTVANLIGGRLPSDRVIDGRDLLPLMTGNTTDTPHPFLFHYCGSYLHSVRYSPLKEGRIYKVHYYTAKWSPGVESCADILMCQCYGSFVNHHNPPLIFDLTSDPGEQRPLTPGEAVYERVAKVAAQAVVAHTRGLDQVPNQFSLPNLLYVPWLQPCCNFPFCSCVEEAEP